MIGYTSPDWGMGGWYAREDAADEYQSYVEWCIKWYRPNCVDIADSIARKYYNANGEGYYESDEEFLADDNGCWAEWLLEDAMKLDEHCLTAMKALIKDGEPFTRPEYVLEVIRR